MGSIDQALNSARRQSGTVLMNQNSNDARELFPLVTVTTGWLNALQVASSHVASDSMTKPYASPWNSDLALTFALVAHCSMRPRLTVSLADSPWAE